ncbi:MAG: integrin alpha, partial [Gammaproteobacteria bacterium]|nr:integrin alpha [Gammaproteobacteria bacterium]
TGGFGKTLSDGDRFGSAVAAIGDMNNDGIPDLAGGAPDDDDGADNAGAFWILMMKTDGKIDGWQKVSASAGGFNGNLEADDNFGAAITGVGNLDNRELTDIAAGAPGKDDDGEDKGAIWILFMERKI